MIPSCCIIPNWSTSTRFSTILPSARTAGTVTSERASVGVDDGANVFTPDRRGDPFRLAAVDDLELTDEPRVDEEVGEEFVEGEALERVSLQLARADRFDEARISILLWVLSVEPIHVLHQRHRLGAEALAKDEATGIGAMRRYAPDPGRMLPERVGGDAVEDHAGGGVDKEGEEMPEDLRRDRHHAVRGEERSQNVGVAERVGHRDLREHAGGEAEVETDREDVTAPDTAAYAEDQLLAFEERAESFDHRIGSSLPRVDDRATADLDDVDIR